MRILYLCQRIPFPPDRGDRIPVFHQIRHLRKEHEVTVGSLDHQGVYSDGRGLKETLGLTLLAPRHSRTRRATGMISSFLTGNPLTLGNFYNSKLRVEVDQLLQMNRIDAIILFSSSMAQYAEGARVPRIMYFCDIDSQKWAELADRTGGYKKWIYRREARLLLEYERKIAMECEASCVITPNEAELFRLHIPGVPVHVLENGVDSDFFAGIPRKPTGTTLVFVGVMDYPPNVEAVTRFAEKVWPSVRASYPDALFTVVGARPNREVARLKKVPGITVTGRVPDIRPFLASATLMVAPIAVARGVQNKILEAIAAGVPVVTTPVVAKGLPAGAEDLVFVAELEQFADEVKRVLENSSSREEKAEKARRFVRESCSWESKLKVLDELLLMMQARTGPIRRPGATEAKYRAKI